MLRLRDKSKGVPDFFRYTHAEDGWVSTGINWWDMWENSEGSVVKHRNGNGYPPVTEAEVENQLCEQIGPAYCQQDDPGSPTARFVNTRLKWSHIVEGVKPYLKFLVGAITPVSQTEADRRARVCASCYLRVNPQGCGSCVKIARLITGEIAGKKTQHDSHLVNRACAVCACPVASLVWFPMPILETPEVDSPEKQKAYPDFCWRKRGAVNYQPESV